MTAKKWFFGREDLGGYMKRLLLKTPWFTLRFHRILRSDEGRDFHDHPWEFSSLILSGGYVEHRPGCKCVRHGDADERGRQVGCCCSEHKGKILQFRSFRPSLKNPCRFYGPGSIVRRRAEDLHRLELVNGPAWTLVLTGPYRREWGFVLSDGTWVGFRAYHRSFYGEGKS